MNILNKILTLFAESDDEDVSAEEGFQTSFANVVNFMLLVYCTIGGVYSLLRENSGIAISDIIFSILFILYFISHYFIKRSPLIIGFNRLVIFSQFIVAYINGSLLGLANITIQIYPFVAIILHGRKMGTILSFLQIVVLSAYSTFGIKHLLPIPFEYSVFEVCTIMVVQTVSIFVYLVAIRWLSAMIYDRIIEVGQLNGSLNIKSEMIKRITTDINSQLSTLKKSADLLVKNRLNRPQMEQATNIRATAANLLNTIDAIASASELDIRPIDKEDIVFNIHNAISNALLLFENKDSKEQSLHTINISPEVPQEIRGNSLLVRQIILSIFDSIDKNFKMDSTPITIKISLHDITADNLIIGFAIVSDNKIYIDHRDLSTSETKLLYQLRLESTLRMVEAFGGEFRALTTEEETLEIHFTLPFKKASTLTENINDNPIEQLLNNKTKLTDIRLLVIDNNFEYCEQLKNIMQPHIKEIVTAPHSKVALKLYENSKFDVALINMSEPSIEGHLFIRSVRDIETGLGISIPIYVIVDDEQQNVYLGDLEGKIDGFVTRSASAQEIISKIKETIDIEI